MDNGSISAVVFLDLANAFDTISHSVLLKKLYALGVKSKDLKWFSAYLENREQQTAYNGLLSQKQLIFQGVLLGSALGPLLFLVYINSLPNYIEYSNINMFADDTALFLTGSSEAEIESKINSDLNSISQYLEANKLVINTA